MSDENTYTAPDGTKYRAAESSGQSCAACAFAKQSVNTCRLHPCMTHSRADNRNIVWIKESP